MRFYDRETIRGIMIPRLADIHPLIMIGWIHWTKKRVNYSGYIESEGGMMDICWITQYYAAFVSILSLLHFLNIFCVNPLETENCIAFLVLYVEKFHNPLIIYEKADP